MASLGMSEHVAVMLHFRKYGL